MNSSKQTRLNQSLRALDGVLSHVETLGQHLLPKRWSASAMPLLLQGVGRLKTLHPKQHLNAQQPVQARHKLQQSLLAIQYGYAVRKQHDFHIDLNTHSLAARHYLPEKTQQLPALLLYFHGGGFVLGNIETHDDICRFLCQQTGLQVISVDYRLAPEHPFPAGLNDARAALQWVKQHAARFNVKPEHIAVGGDSAGGNYAALLSQEYASDILASLLIYPSTDRSRIWPSAQQHANSAYLSATDRQWFYQHYIKHSNATAQLKEVSPLLGLQQQANHAALATDTNVAAVGTALAPLTPTAQTPPATLLVTGGYDALQDEGKAYAEALSACYATVEYLHFERLDHGFMHFIAVNKVAYLAAKQVTLKFRALCQTELERLATVSSSTKTN